MARGRAAEKRLRDEFAHPQIVDPGTLNLGRAVRPHNGEGSDHERGPISRDLSSYRLRTRHSEPLEVSDDDLIRQVFASNVVKGLGDLIEDAFPYATGRPRNHHRLVYFAANTCVALTGRSARWFFRQLKDRERWASLRSVVATAHGIVLSEKPPTIDEYWHFKKHHIKADHSLYEHVDTLVKDDAVRVAKVIGCGASERATSSKPDPCNVMYGDATWVHAMYRLHQGDPRARRIDPETGEITMRRCDPDARPYHRTDEPGDVGSMWAIGQMTNGNAHETVVLYMDPIANPQADGKYCADAAIRLKNNGLSVHGLGYDMALHSEPVELLQTEGIMPITKVARRKNGSLEHRIIPQQTFRLTDGSTETVDIQALDGAPYIATLVDGEERWVRLDRTSWESRPTRAYITCRVPNVPGPPSRLRGATVRIRTTSTEAEIARRELRSSAIRPISQGDPAFRGLFGHREGVEATNAHWKNSLPGRRQRSVGHIAQRFDANCYQIARNLKAALAWHLRTGGDVHCIWRNGIPPGTLPEPVGIAA